MKQIILTGIFLIFLSADHAGGIPHSRGELAGQSVSFGTTGIFDLLPKPAYNALKAMNEQLRGLTLAHRISLDNSNDYILLFVSPAGIFRLCAWTTDKPHSIRLDITAAHSKALKAADGNGNVFSLQSDQDGLKLDLNELPQYITLPCGIKLN